MTTPEIVEKIVLPISLALFAVAGGLFGNVLAHWLEKRKKDRERAENVLFDIYDRLVELNHLYLFLSAHEEDGIKVYIDDSPQHDSHAFGSKNELKNRILFKRLEIERELKRNANNKYLKPFLDDIFLAVSLDKKVVYPKGPSLEHAKNIVKVIEKLEQHLNPEILALMESISEEKNKSNNLNTNKETGSELINKP